MSQTSKKTGVGCLYALGQIVLVAPFWYYLLYRVLVAIHADTAMWVCYWLYVPLGFMLGLVKAAWDEME